MSKKPASLTSDLLARKGEAEPSTIDPSARMTLSAGPGFDEEYGGGRTEPHNDDDQGDDDGYDHRSSRRPMPPEPEIIYTAEESRGGGSNTRLIIATVLGLVIVGGIFLATSGKETNSVAPVQSNVAPQAVPAETSAAPSNMTTAETAEAPVTAPTTTPAAPETTSAAPTVDTTSSETKIPVVEAPSANAPTDISPNVNAAPAAAPATQVPPVAEAPTEAPIAAPAKIAAPAANAKLQSNGAYVVQLLALQDEASAKAAWKKVSKKHASILGGHALNIEKADLGAKGTWYRVRAAGFTTKAAAASACTKLKAAGQDCIAKKR